MGVGVEVVRVGIGVRLVRVGVGVRVVRMGVGDGGKLFYCLVETLKDLTCATACGGSKTDNPGLNP